MKVTLATVVATAGLLIAPIVVAAPMYKVEFEAQVSALIASQTLALPLPIGSDPVELEVTFLVDPSTEQLFGDFTCSPGPTHCGAWGYEVSELHVHVNGVEADGWRTGTTAQSFFNGLIDLRGSDFFTPGGLADIQSAWLPMVHDDFAGAALNFGQMYTSVGGVNFTPLMFSAIDAAGQRANGAVSARSTLLDVAALPAPGTTALLTLGVALLSLRRRHAVQLFIWVSVKVVLVALRPPLRLADRHLDP